MNNDKGRLEYDQLTSDKLGKKLCFGSVIPVTENPNASEISNIVHDLLQSKHTRVVVLILMRHELVELIMREVANQSVPKEHFVWILHNLALGMIGMEITDTSAHLGYLEGAFYFYPTSSRYEEFDSWLSKQTLNDVPTDTFFHKLYEERCNCSVKNRSCDRHIQIGNCSTPHGPLTSPVHMRLMLEPIHEIAKMLIDPNCSQTQDYTRCVSSLDERLVSSSDAWWSDKYMEIQIRTLFVDKSENTSQIQRRVVGKIDVVKKTSNFTDKTTEKRIGQIKSVCSLPCDDPTMQVSVGNGGCCWKCTGCLHGNEQRVKTTSKSHKCKPCPEFQWPNPDNRTECHYIIPKRIQLTHIDGFLVGNVAVLGLITCVAVAVYFLWNRRLKVIKAASIELSLIMLSGLFLGYLDILLTFYEPDETLCRIIYIFFNLSFTLVYAPLMLKTLRIYRIFVQKRTSVKGPRFIKNRDQMIFTACLVAIMVVLNIVATYDNENEFHGLEQPDRQKKEVELSCQLQVWDLLLGLTYIGILMAITAVLACMIRHVSGAYNEALLICMSVLIFFVILVSFGPFMFKLPNAEGKNVQSTYLMQIHALNLMLALNHTLNLFTFFFSKVYAIMFVEGYRDLYVEEEDVCAGYLYSGASRQNL
jgi:metabotropic glutamate receptor 2/3/metabotropic glutamate receptor 6/7/8